MTIPASDIVNVIPGVVDSGGQGLVLNGIMLTTNARVPIGAVLPLSNLAAVEDYFGPTSDEATYAANYFGGYENAQQTPGLLYFKQYPTASVAAWLRGASLDGMTLDELKAVTGSLSVTIDGGAKSAASINLSTATSFSNAASLLATALGLSGGQTMTFDSISLAFVITSGTTGVTSTITVASGTAAAALGLAAGTTSQGAAAATPAAAMSAILPVTQNWAAFMTLFEPVIADKLAFAAWTNAQNDRYLYLAWDTDPNAIVANNTTAFGPQIVANDSSSTVPISGSASAVAGTGKTLAQALTAITAFVLGAIASINFGQTNGRITFAFKSQSGITPSVVDSTIAKNLIANGYNFYGAYATANDGFSFFNPGLVAGKYKWLDVDVNQIWLNSQLQLALMTLLTSMPSIPYNESGYSLIKAACRDPIDQALTFGAIRPGVSLSASQAAQVNAAAGLAIDKTLTQQGWYLKVRDPGAQARGNRTSPECTLWYMDGGAVQQIVLASIVVL